MKLLHKYTESDWPNLEPLTASGTTVTFTKQQECVTPTQAKLLCQKRNLRNVILLKVCDVLEVVIYTIRNLSRSK